MSSAITKVPSERIHEDVLNTHLLSYLTEDEHASIKSVCQSWQEMVHKKTSLSRDLRKLISRMKDNYNRVRSSTTMFEAKIFSVLLSVVLLDKILLPDFLRHATSVCELIDHPILIMRGLRMGRFINTKTLLASGCLIGLYYSGTFPSIPDDVYKFAILSTQAHYVDIHTMSSKVYVYAKSALSASVPLAKFVQSKMTGSFFRFIGFAKEAVSLTKFSSFST